MGITKHGDKRSAPTPSRRIGSADEEAKAERELVADLDTEDQE